MNKEIKIKELYKSFDVNGERLQVFENLSLEIPEHEIVVVLGKSGCGKTTLLRLFGGLDKDFQGEICHGGDVKSAFVFQEPRLMPWLDVWDNIIFGLKKKEVNAEEIQELITMTGLTGFEHAMPGQLSGGMRQRVALARALALKPELILMDEPFAALDYFTRESMQQALLEIQRRTACGVLFVTHSIDEAITLGDRVVIIDDKKVKKVYALKEKRRDSSLTAAQIAALKENILQTINA